MKITDLPAHLRPREKLISHGVAGLKNAELLAILLRTGMKGKNAVEMARQIISRIGESELTCVQLDSLYKVAGIDKAKASVIVAAFELARRLNGHEKHVLPVIELPEDVLHHCSHLQYLKKEHFVALYLDARSRLIHKETISMGTVNTSIVHPREVFAPALQHHAVALIVVHNHPSGELEPSQEDIVVTQRLRQAGTLLGIDLLDHIIVSEKGYYSFKEEENLSG